MKKTLTFGLFAVLFFIVAGTVSASSLFTQTISLNAGWNIVSTPRVLDSHSFSTAETVNNFDIYVLNPSDPSGWSTMAGLGHAEFQPLYGYFIKNKTGVDQTLTLNYKPEVNPNERLFERKFSQAGWYSIGPANPTYVKSKCSDASDVNNVGNILNSLNSKFSNVIDFTDGSFFIDPNSVKVDTQWKSVTSSDVNSLRDLRELKGYGIYISQSGALYNGFQNTSGICTSLVSIAITTPATKLSYFVGDTLDLAGLVVTGTYSDGAQQTEPITTANVAGFDSATPAIGQVLTVTVGGQTTTYTIDIVAAPITLQSIAITHPANKLSYSVNESLDLTGLVVTGTYSDASTKVETITEANVTGFDSSASITGQVLTITVDGKTATYTITVYTAPTFAAVGDTATNKYNQTLLGPVSQAITGTIKVTASDENQRLRDVVLTGVTSAGNVDDYVSSVALYDGTTQIANFITPVGNTATFTTTDMIVPTTFIKNTPKVLNIVANIIFPSTQGTTLYWTIGAAANQFRTTGITSGAVATNPLTLTDLRTNIGAYNEGGTYTMRSNVLEMSKSADSPSSTLARGTFVTVAKYDLNSKGNGQNLGLSAVTFTSTVGLPAALTSSVAATGVLNDATLFRLYDVDNAVAIPATSFLNVANGTIAFSGITAAAFPAVTYGQTRHLALQVTTTNQALWPAYTSLLFTIQKATDVIVPNAGVGFGGAVYSIPAIANTVTIGS